MRFLGISVLSFTAEKQLSLSSRICAMKAVAVVISSEILETIFHSAKRLFPKETILLLRGKKTKGSIEITELVVPPLANYGHGFASVPLHMLPIDFSIVGTVHSHPSGDLTPSVEDCNHLFGTLLMIVGFPFAGQENIVVYNSSGDRLPLHVSR